MYSLDFIILYVIVWLPDTGVGGVGGGGGGLEIPI